MTTQEYQTPHDIVIPQGATWREQYTYALNADGTGAIDLSAYTPQGQIRAKKDKDSTLIASFTFDMSDAANGNVTASLSATTTEAITSNGYYDIELHANSGGEVIRLVQGKAYLDKEVTA